ncbi:PhzF family phenazine biosynthesis protein [Novosphingobium sp.]|uniref:PhzF family phenazine biosynthesis protein n=1 Tax=Novosphingobium sp. TaxID=1874826 RepID=UPI003D0F84F5
MQLPFKQVDVFSTASCRGNPVCVFLESTNLSTADMQRIANWTNLSETTFVSKSDRADYAVRIFTTQSELPFAGHPTLGTAWALREAGIVTEAHWVQDCAYGLVHMAEEGGALFFVLPSYQLGRELDSKRVSTAMGVPVSDCTMIHTGPYWVIGYVETLEQLDTLRIDTAQFLEFVRAEKAEGITLYTIDNAGQVHVRTLCNTATGVTEDPVCGSGNAAVAAHVQHTGRITRTGATYEARQGKHLGRDGRIQVNIGEKIRIGGHCNTVLSGVARYG